MYVVIGATGNTGSIVANKLANQGKNVRVVGRNAEHLAQFKKGEAFVGDVTDNDLAPRKLDRLECEFSQTQERRTAMKGTRPSEEQIIAILKQAAAGMTT